MPNLMVGSTHNPRGYGKDSALRIGASSFDRRNAPIGCSSGRGSCSATKVRRTSVPTIATREVSEMLLCPVSYPMSGYHANQPEAQERYGCWLRNRSVVRDNRKIGDP